MIRDIMFGNKRHFREMLSQSQEGIASNILADRLERLVSCGVLTRAPDPSHKQRVLYTLTEMGIALVPVLAQLSVWGRHYLPVSKTLDARAKVLEEGGPEMWAALMREIRALHLEGREPVFEGSVRQELKRAFDAAVGASR